jgi:hypothetical protein
MKVLKQATVGKAVLTEREHRPWRMAARLADVCKLLRARYGEPFSWSDDADLILAPLARCVVDACREQGRHMSSEVIAKYLSGWCHNAPTSDVAAIAADAVENFRAFTAADLGDALAVTVEEREALGLRHIRFAGGRGKAWASYIRQRDRRRKQAARRAAGKLSRDEYLAASRSTADEAKALGVTPRAIRKRRSKSETLTVPGFVRISNDIVRNNGGTTGVSPVSVAGAAASLGVGRATLYRRAKAAGMSVTEYLATADEASVHKAAQPEPGVFCRLVDAVNDLCSLGANAAAAAPSVVRDTCRRASEAARSVTLAA